MVSPVLHEMKDWVQIFLNTVTSNVMSGRIVLDPVFWEHNFLEKFNFKGWVAGGDR